MKILLAVDGSAISTRAVRFAARLMQNLAKPAALVLFHADPPLMRDAAAKLGRAAVQEYQEGNVKFALKGARAALARAKVPYTVNWVAGNPAEAIVEHARRGRFDLIVMGSHGRGSFKEMLLGSVASKVIAHGRTPVTVVR